MRETWSVESVEPNSLFDVDVLKATSGDRSLSLELPRGLIDLSSWKSFELELSKEESDGDLVMKGMVYKCAEGLLEISFHGLWLRMKHSGSCEFSEGDKVYLIIRRLD